MEKDKKGLVSNISPQQNMGQRLQRKQLISRSDYSRFRIPGTSLTNMHQREETVEKELQKKVEKFAENIEQKTESVYKEVESIISEISVPGIDSVKNYSFKVKRSIGEIIGSIAFKVAVTVVIMSVGLGGYVFAVSYNNLNKVLKGGAKSSVALISNVDPSLLSAEGSGRVNVLLMGRGGGSHDGPDLTDTMMIASIDPVDKNITLISIPRDLWVEVPGHGSMKINAVWETGEFTAEGKVAPGSTDPSVIASGYNLVDSTINDVTGIKIDYNVLVNFQAFQQAVDLIGGVTVNVPSTLYDPTMAWMNHGNPVLAKAGIQNFDGLQALVYVRSRETTTDFARGQRQRAVLVAIKQKVESIGIVSDSLKLTGLLNSFGNNVATDLGLSDAMKMYDTIKNISADNIKSVGLTDAGSSFIKTGAMNGQSIDLPIAGLYNYSQIRAYVKSILPDPYITKENARILVLNGTNNPDILNSTVSELKSFGYNIVGTGNTIQKNYAATTLINVGTINEPYTEHYLVNRLNATILKDLPEPINSTTNNPNFVIILGNNATVNN